MRVTAIFQETPNVKTFRLAEEQGGALPFTYLPGQYLTFAADIEGKVMRRSYTIASSPNQTGFLEATIKREEDGVFSRYMHDRIAIGDKVHVTAPSGAFTFRGKEADSVALIGGGVGITPLMSAIRYLTDEAWPGEIYLVYGAKTTRDFIFRDELEYLQRRHANLHVAATMMRAEGTSWMGPEGPITKEFLAQSVPELKRRRCHVCGPPAMMTAVKQALAELGVPKEQVRSEAFGTAKGALPPPGVTEIAGASGSANLRVSTGTATPTISFAQSAKSAPLPADKTVLEVAESIGVPIDFQCRAGICGICKTKLLEGKVTMEVEDALTPEDKAQSMILACQAKSIGNLVVDA
jgi:ferredoxin-NADP reductase